MNGVHLVLAWIILSSDSIILPTYGGVLQDSTTLWTDFYFIDHLQFASSMNRTSWLQGKDVYVRDITVQPHWVHTCQHGVTQACYFSALFLHASAHDGWDALHIWRNLWENDNYM